MTAPDLPAELKAALDAKLHGLSRSDAAERAAIISQTYRGGGSSGAIRVRDRCAGLCAGADARDLCRGHRKPERAPRDHAGFCAGKPARCRRRAGNGDMGRGRGIFRRCEVLRLLDANAALRALALDLGRDSTRLRDMTYQRGEARAALADAEPADLVVASYMIGEIDERRAKNARRADVGQDPRYAADRRARHAGGLCADHRAAGAVDRLGRACRSPLPA